MPFGFSIMSSAPSRRRMTSAAMVASAFALASCQIFSTEVKNPNAVTEDAIATASAAATSLVNGLYGSVNAAGNQIVGTTGAVADELTWVGSREYWNLLDGGDAGDPLNEYTNGQFSYAAQARWLTDYVIPKLEGYDKAAGLRNRADLAQAYFLGATIYTFIGETYEDFVISSIGRPTVRRWAKRTCASCSIRLWCT